MTRDDCGTPIGNDEYLNDDQEPCCFDCWSEVDI